MFEKDTVRTITDYIATNICFNQKTLFAGSGDTPKKIIHDLRRKANDYVKKNNNEQGRRLRDIIYTAQVTKHDTHKYFTISFEDESPKLKIRLYSEYSYTGPSEENFLELGRSICDAAKQIIKDEYNENIDELEYDSDDDDDGEERKDSDSDRPKNEEEKIRLSIILRDEIQLIIDLYLKFEEVVNAHKINIRTMVDKKSPSEAQQLEENFELLKEHLRDLTVKLTENLKIEPKVLQEFENQLKTGSRDTLVTLFPYLKVREKKGTRKKIIRKVFCAHIEHPVNSNYTIASADINTTGIRNFRSTELRAYEEKKDKPIIIHGDVVNNISSASITSNGILKKQKRVKSPDKHLTMLHKHLTVMNIKQDLVPELALRESQSIAAGTVRTARTGSETEEAIILPYVLHTLVSPISENIDSGSNPDYQIVNSGVFALDYAKSRVQNLVTDEDRDTKVLLDPIYFNTGVNFGRGVFSSYEDRVNNRAYNNLLELVNRKLRRIKNKVNLDESIKACSDTEATRLFLLKKIKEYTNIINTITNDESLTMLIALRDKEDDKLSDLFGQLRRMDAELEIDYELLELVAEAQHDLNHQVELSDTKKDALTKYITLVSTEEYTELLSAIEGQYEKVFAANNFLAQKRQELFKEHESTLDTLDDELHLCIPKCSEMQAYEYNLFKAASHLRAFNNCFINRYSDPLLMVLSKVPKLKSFVSYRRNRYNFGVAQILPTLANTLKRLGENVYSHYTCKSGNDRTGTASAHQSAYAMETLLHGSSPNHEDKSEHKSYMRNFSRMYYYIASSLSAGANRAPSLMKFGNKGTMFLRDSLMKMSVKVTKLYKKKFKEDGVTKQVILFITSPISLATALTTLVLYGVKKVVTPVIRFVNPFSESRRVSRRARRTDTETKKTFPTSTLELNSNKDIITQTNPMFLAKVHSSFAKARQIREELNSMATADHPGTMRDETVSRRIKTILRESALDYITDTPSGSIPSFEANVDSMESIEGLENPLCLGALKHDEGSASPLLTEGFDSEPESKQGPRSRKVFMGRGDSIRRLSAPTNPRSLKIAELTKQLSSLETGLPVGGTNLGKRINVYAPTRSSPLSSPTNGAGAGTSTGKTLRTVTTRITTRFVE